MAGTDKPEKKLPADYADFRRIKHPAASSGEFDPKRLNNTKQWVEYPPIG
jgi:hypothetical protein